VGGAALLVATRIGLWLGVQLGLAGLLILGGKAASGGQALDEAAGWWMVYAALVDLGTLGVILWLLRRDGGSYRGLLGPPTTAWQVALGAAGVLAASVPAVVFSAQLTSARSGDGAIAPMFAIVDLPPWASVVSVVVVVLAELAEPVAYLGVVLPRLERRLGRPWLAAVIVVAIWAAEHALYPLLVSGGGLDGEFAAYRSIGQSGGSGTARHLGSSSVDMGLRQRLAELDPQASRADHLGAVHPFAEATALHGHAAPDAGGTLPGRCTGGHRAASWSACWTLVCSSATRAASSLRSSPTRRPSEVVTGEDGRSWWTMRWASSSIGTWGRKVLGPGRMTCSTGSCWSRWSSSARSRPSTTRWWFTTTQASHPAARVRSRTWPIGSSSRQVGTSRRATSPARGRSAFRPSVGRPAASQSSSPST
jgi:hypothetical protein